VIVLKKATRKRGKFKDFGRNVCVVIAFFVLIIFSLIFRKGKKKKMKPCTPNYISKNPR
jgi:hypothetical protein